MHLDVMELRDFYYRSALGRAAQRVVRDQLVEWWSDPKGHTVVGFGFAAPLLRPFLADARRVIGLMPGPQGVMPWPAGEANVSVLCEDTLWPVETGHVDKLVLMHGLETSDYPGALLDECWRVLGPGGSAVFIVPNRGGLWSRSDRTPFGYGRPYTMGQLERQLRLHKFSIVRHLSTLYQPPSHKRGWRKSARLMERLGHRLPWITAGGVLMVEVRKEMSLGGGTAVRAEAPKSVLAGLGAPVAEPA